MSWALRKFVEGVPVVGIDAGLLPVRNERGRMALLMGVLRYLFTPLKKRQFLLYLCNFGEAGGAVIVFCHSILHFFAHVSNVFFRQIAAIPNIFLKHHR